MDWPTDFDKNDKKAAKIGFLLLGLSILGVWKLIDLFVLLFNYAIG